MVGPNFQRSILNLCGIVSTSSRTVLANSVISVTNFSTTSVDLRSHPKRFKRTTGFAPDEFDKKPAQEWWDYDGFGKYKARYHQYPTNLVLRDVQRRRILAQHAEERNRVNCLFRNDILPKELQELARIKVVKEVPRDSAITRPNRRCAITGRARGIFHQFRVSRMVFRKEADGNRLSGVQYAKWMYNTHLDP